MAQLQSARFVTGSTLRHVLVMTLTSSVGLMAVFVVDALNLLYISMLGQQELAAAIGYSGTILFFLTSVAIGLSIATTAQVSRALGRGAGREAAELGGAGLGLIAFVLALLALLMVVFARPMLAGIGASGQTLELATRFLHMVTPSMPLMAVGMTAAALLRAKGDAKRSMYVTLAAAFATAILDPIFIFVFGLGLDGAAIVTNLSRIVMLAVGLHAVLRLHGLAAWPSAATLKSFARPYFAIGIPAVMTQLATPVGNAFITNEIAGFGDAAVAGWAVLGRLTPVAFGAIFALSGAVGPILGQNFGARQFGRIQSTMSDSLKVVVVYTLVVWALMALLRNQICDLFGAEGATRELINFFCLYVAGSFVFNGMLFVANAAFNNLGYPLYSTLSNWGRSTLGVIPFVTLGASWYGANGALAGSGIGAAVFGIGAIVVCFRVLKTLESANPPTAGSNPPPAANSPFSSGKAASAG